MDPSQQSWHRFSIQNLKTPSPPSRPRPLPRELHKKLKLPLSACFRGKTTFLAKVRGHVLKALVASARALPQGILARLRGHHLVVGPYPKKDVLTGSLSGLVFPIKREGSAAPAFSPGCEQSPASREMHAAPRTC